MEEKQILETKKVQLLNGAIIDEIMYMELDAKGGGRLVCEVTYDGKTYYRWPESKYKRFAQRYYRTERGMEFFLDEEIVPHRMARNIKRISSILTFYLIITLVGLFIWIVAILATV